MSRLIAGTAPVDASGRSSERQPARSPCRGGGFREIV
jgi:hypothetical protein